MREHIHISHRWVQIILCGCLLLWGCDESKDRALQDKTAVQPQAGGIYRLPITQNPASLDPALVHHKYDVVVVQQIFDGLIRFDPYLTPRPALARTWRIGENGQEYIFTLRNDARFHNGKSVTIGDVIFSLSRLLRVTPPPAIVPHLLKIEGATAYRDHRTDDVIGLKSEGENRLRVRLIEPHVPFLAALGMYQAKIVPQDAVKADPEAFGRRPIGSGPFRFVSWEQDRSIRLNRFDEYYDGRSFLDEVRFPIYTNQQTQRLLDDFKHGKLEEIPIFSAELKAALTGHENLQWFHRPSLSLFFYGINCQNSPLDNPELRRLLSASIDRKKLVETVFHSRFDTAQTILPPGMPGYQPPERPIEDRLIGPQQSKAAGMTDADSVIEIVSAYDTPNVRAEMAFVRDSWQNHGIRLKTKIIPDWDKFNAYIQSNEVQVYRYAWFADMPDPDSFLHPLFSSGSADNHMRFKNQEVDEILAAARGTLDPVKRNALYRKAEKQVLMLSPLIPLFHMSEDRVYRGAVQNARPSALGAHTMSLHKIWLDHSQ